MANPRQKNACRIHNPLTNKFLCSELAVLCKNSLLTLCLPKRHFRKLRFGPEFSIFFSGQLLPFQKKKNRIRARLSPEFYCIHTYIVTAPLSSARITSTQSERDLFETLRVVPKILESLNNY